LNAGREPDTDVAHTYLWMPTFSTTPKGRNHFNLRTELWSGRKNIGCRKTRECQRRVILNPYHSIVTLFQPLDSDRPQTAALSTTR
jgi:hypothetical protein